MPCQEIMYHAPRHIERLCTIYHTTAHQAATCHRACHPMSRGHTSHRTATHCATSSRHTPRATLHHIKRPRAMLGRCTPCTVPHHVEPPHTTQHHTPCPTSRGPMHHCMPRCSTMRDRSEAR